MFKPEAVTWNRIGPLYSRTMYGEVTDSVKNTWLIVSQLVSAVPAERPDMRVPAEVIRGENYSVIGYRAIG